MRVELVDFISVPTRDVERGVAWYREVLGLPRSRVTAGEVEARNVTFSFWEPERESLPFVANVAGVAAARAGCCGGAGGTGGARDRVHRGDVGLGCLSLRPLPGSRWEHADPAPPLRAAEGDV